MKIIKVSEFLDNDIPPFLFGTFFSRRVFTDDEKYIYTYTYYKESKKVNTKFYKYEEYDDIYLDILNRHSGKYNYWNTKDYFKSLGIKIDTTGQFFFVLENDINITKESIYNKLRSKLLSKCEWIGDDDKLNNEKKEFIRGMVELRGSIDTTANYIATDYFADSTNELKKAGILIDYLSIPYYAANFNFRNLQKDYTEGINKRNKQFRLNVWWYMENIGIMNGYKAEVFAISRKIPLGEPNNDVYYFHNDTYKIRYNNNNLNNRLNYYYTNLAGKEPTKREIQKMRAELGFDDTPKSFRNQTLVDMIKKYTPDICASCNNEGNLMERTYNSPKTGKPVFIVHHVISYDSNKELDDLNNMVKLCPYCHDILHGTFSEEVKKNVIRKIFMNQPKTLNFARSFFDCNDYLNVIKNTVKLMNVTFNKVNNIFYK